MSGATRERQAAMLEQELVPLRLDHGYPRANPESAYWSLAPFLVQQMTVSSCGLATMTMILNGARALGGDLAMGSISTEEGLLDLLDEEKLRAGVQPNGGGMSLVDFARRMERALEIHGLAKQWRVSFAQIDDPSKALEEFRAGLARMEAGRAFIAVNFHLDRFYGDGVDVGHFSPLGGYDRARDRVLMLDVYKADYEPMWASVPRLMDAMATVSPKTGERRGYASIER